MKTRVFLLIALLALSGCDNKHAEKRDASNGGEASTDATALPPEIAAAYAPTSGETIWLDVSYASHGCPYDPNSIVWASLYYKQDNEPWPQMQFDDPIALEHPMPAPLDPALDASLRSGLIADLKQGQFVVQQQHYNGMQGSQYCDLLVPTRLGSSYSSYKNSAGTEVRGLVNVAHIAFGASEFVSEFERMTPRGENAKFRKYRLNAVISENAQFGGRTIPITRDSVIYFDPEDRIWRGSPGEQTPWQQK